MIGVVLLASLTAASAAGLLIVPAGKWLTSRGLVAANYRGKPLPFGLGLILVPAYLTGIGAFGLALGRPWSEALPFSIALSGLGLVGFADDVLGQGRHGGLCGHGAILLREGRLTTGGLKAIGAIAVALTLTGWRPPPPGLLVDAGLIALGANVLNLFDVRPGRALGVFWLAVLAIFTVSVERQAVMPVLPLLAASIALVPSDFGGRAMLGDAGANALGGAAGLLAVEALAPAGRETALTLLVMLQVAGEFGSLSRMVTRVLGLKAVLARLPGRGSWERNSSPPEE